MKEQEREIKLKRQFVKLHIRTNVNKKADPCYFTFTESGSVLLFISLHIPLCHITKLQKTIW